MRLKPKPKIEQPTQPASPSTVVGDTLYVKTLTADSTSPVHRSAWELLRGDQRYTLLFGGSRGGKTVLLVKALIMRAQRAPGSRHAILRFRANSIWPSIGLDTFPKVMELFFPGVAYEPFAHQYFKFPNASEIWLGGLDEKERAEKILGNEYATIFLNECSQIPYSSYNLAVTRLAQNIGLKQRIYLDLNPVGKGHWTNVLFHQHKEPNSGRALPNPDDYKSMHIPVGANAANLTQEYIQSLELMPLKQRQRFFEGLYQDETEGALWTLEGIETLRVSRLELPDMQRIVVAVDPSGAGDSLDNTHDPIGIVVCGLGVDGHGYLLGDYTCLAGPNEWGRRAVNAFHNHGADAIVGETNYGGAMVQFVINSIDPSVPFRDVKATRGKVVRAEPVSSLASVEDKDKHGGPGNTGWRIHNVGDPLPNGDVTRYPELETELCNFTNMGYIGPRSPNRADAYVWGFTELMLGESIQGWVDHYGNIVNRALGRAPKPKVVGKPKPVARVTLKAPGPHMSFAPATGVRYTSDENSMIHNIEPDHVAAMQKAGCIHPDGDGI